MKTLQVLIWGLLGALVRGYPKMMSRPISLFYQKQSYLDTIRFVVDPSDKEHTPDTPYQLSAVCNDYTNDRVEFSPLPIFCSGIPFVGTISNLVSNLQTMLIKLTRKGKIDYSQMGIDFELRRVVDKLLVGASHLKFEPLESFIVFDMRRVIEIPISDEPILIMLGNLDARIRNEFGDWGFAVDFVEKKKLPSGLRLTTQKDTLILEGRLTLGAETPAQLLHFRLRDLTTELVTDQFKVIIGNPDAKSYFAVWRLSVAIYLFILVGIVALVVKRLRLRKASLAKHQLPMAKVQVSKKPGIFNFLSDKSKASHKKNTKKTENSDLNKSSYPLKTEESEIIISSTETPASGHLEMMEREN